MALLPFSQTFLTVEIWEMISAATHSHELLLILLLPIKFNLFGTFGFVLQKYIKKQQSERSKKLKEDKLLKERAVRERQLKLEVLYMCIHVHSFGAGHL